MKISLNNIYSDKSTLNDNIHWNNIKDSETSNLLLQICLLYNTLIEQYINSNTGMLCNKYMNIKKVKKVEEKK